MTRSTWRTLPGCIAVHSTTSSGMPEIAARGLSYMRHVDISTSAGVRRRHAHVAANAPTRANSTSRATPPPIPGAVYRDQASGSEKTILHSSNPEVVLSLPDLLSAALAADDAQIERDLTETVRKFKAGTPDELVEQAGASYQGRHEHLSRIPLQDARKARLRLLHVLEVSFRAPPPRRLRTRESTPK